MVASKARSRTHTHSHVHAQALARTRSRTHTLSQGRYVHLVCRYNHTTPSQMRWRTDRLTDKVWFHTPSLRGSNKLPFWNPFYNISTRQGDTCRPLIQLLHICWNWPTSFAATTGKSLNVWSFVGSGQRLPFGQLDSHEKSEIC